METKDEEFARILQIAEDNIGEDFYFGEGGGGAGDDPYDSDYGSRAKKKGRKKKRVSASGPVGAGSSGAGPSRTPQSPAAAAAARRRKEKRADEEEEAGVTPTGRRKRKDAGSTRSGARPWAEEEEQLFVEALTLYGRDWKRCAEHVVTRDHRAIASHAQKWMIKVLMRGEDLPGVMARSGYTLSGKPLDPNASAARAYGLRPERFNEVAASGVLELGVHVTTLEMHDGPPTKRELNKMGGVSAPPGAKRGRKPGSKNHSTAAAAAAAAIAAASDTDYDDADGTLAAAIAASTGDAAGGGGDALASPSGRTEYSKNRPKRQVVSTQAQMGATTESLELTHVHEFSGMAPQPFSVTIAPEALLVMDFHAHLSFCEIIGLLGGTFEPSPSSGEKPALVIQAAFPCRRSAGSHSSTSVELDAEHQFAVMQEMEALGMRAVGWYHSHPVFEPRPSAKDNENQRNYQAVCRDEDTGLEPWVGAIVGPYDQMLPTPASVTRLWVVQQKKSELIPFNVEHSRLPPSAVPLPGDIVEQQLITALEQAKDDFQGRVDLCDTWRFFSTLLQGQQPAGDPLSMADKLRLALRVHLPRDKPEEIKAFMERLGGYFLEHWGVDLAPRRKEKTAAAGKAAAGAVANGGAAAAVVMVGAGGSVEAAKAEPQPAAEEGGVVLFLDDGLKEDRHGSAESPAAAAAAFVPAEREDSPANDPVRRDLDGGLAGTATAAGGAAAAEATEEGAVDIE